MDLKSNEYKKCIKCSNTSSKYPLKVFVRVPTNVKKRINWLNLANIDPQSLSGQSIIYMCEDHFDIEDCATNYMQYKLGSENLIMKKNAVPTKFGHKTSSKPKKSATRRSKRLRKNLAAKSQSKLEELKELDILQPTKRRLSESDDDDISSRIAALEEKSESRDVIFDNIGKIIAKKLKSLSLEHAVSVLQQIVPIINKPFNSNKTTSTTEKLRKIRKVTHNEDFTKSPAGEVTSKGSSIYSFQVMSLPPKTIRNILPPKTIRNIQSSPQPPAIQSSPKQPLKIIQGSPKAQLKPIKTDDTKRIIRVPVNSVPKNISWITSLLSGDKTIDLPKYKTILESIASSSNKTMEENPKACNKTMDKRPEVFTIHHPSIYSDHTYSIPPILEPSQPDNACVVYIMDNNNRVVSVKELISNQVVNEKTAVESPNILKLDGKESATSNKLTGVKTDTSKKCKRKKKSTAKKRTIQKFHKTSKPEPIENDKAVKIKEEIQYYDYSTDTASSGFDYCDRLNDMDDFSQVVCKFEPEEEALVKSEPESVYDDPMAER